MGLPDFFGLDVGNSSIKVAQIEKKFSGKPKIEFLGRLDVAGGLIGIGAQDKKSKQLIAEKITQCRDQAGIKTKKVVAAIPEAPVMSKIIDVPDLPEDELENVIFYQAQNHLPVNINDVNLDHIPLARKVVQGNRLLTILLIAAPKSLVNLYFEVVDIAGLELLALETEAIATSRLITFVEEIKSNIMIIDFGSRGVSLSIVKNKSLIYSQSLGNGSDSLTRAIASDFGIDIQQAEQYKRNYGLLENQLEGKIARSLQPIMHILTNEINKTINYFRSHLSDIAPSQIYLMGNGSKLPGLAEYFTKNIGVASVLVDPVSKIDMSDRARADAMQNSTLGYNVAVGLALKTE